MRTLFSWNTVELTHKTANIWMTMFAVLYLALPSGYAALQKAVVIKIELTLPHPLEENQHAYITGNFNDWNPADPAYRLQTTDNHVYNIQLELPAGFAMEYKYTLGGWMHVEVNTHGVDLDNRTALADEDLVIKDEVASWMGIDPDSGTGLVSRPGEYRGFSQEGFNGWERQSQYVVMRDGVRIAVDVLLPTLDGQLPEEPLPLVWTLTRYQRAYPTPEGIKSMPEFMPSMQNLLRHGYIVAIADVRGTGASFGSRRGEFTPSEIEDAYEIIEWFAAQSWCSGKIGMYGGSYLAITQYLAASLMPPSLTAIMPEFAVLDLYEFVMPNGVYRRQFMKEWSAGVSHLDRNVQAPPVFEDPDGSLRDQAAIGRENHVYPFITAEEAPFRNSFMDRIYAFPNIEFNPFRGLQGMNESNIPVYHVAGWFDAWPKDQLMWYLNLDNPQKIVIGPWAHSGTDPFQRQPYSSFLAAEQHRWFDYWLKGIDNGIMDEEPILYYTMNADKPWNHSTIWPPADSQFRDFWLTQGPSGSVNSVNDGLLSSIREVNMGGYDRFTADYSASSGPKTRWTDTHGGGFDYPDLSENDRKGLTYTTAILEEDLIITGHPLLTLYASADVEDFNLHVYLQDVDSTGFARYITEGVMNVAFRDTQEPPYYNMGLPWRRGNAEDVQPYTPGSVVELHFDMHPTSHVFRAGHRLRISIHAADKHNATGPVHDPPAVVQILHDDVYASFLSLPVVSVETDQARTPYLIYGLLLSGIVLIFLIAITKARAKH